VSRSHRARTWLLVALCTAQFMSMLDITVVNLALPSIRGDLGLGVAGLQWAVGGYVLAFACLLLTGGALGDRFGRRRVFTWGLAVFTAGSLVCGAASSAQVLVAGRVVQGVGAALFVPATLAILTRAFPEQRERARAIGVWAGVSALALPVGPILGGALVGALGWQSVFWLNGPIGVAALLVAFRVVPATPAVTRHLDGPGQVLAIGWLGLLTYALVEAERLGWGSPGILAALTGGGVLLVLFLAVEARAAHPMVPLGLFRNRRFAAGNGVIFLVAFGLIGSFFSLSLFLQQVQGYSPAQAGLRMLPLLLPAAVAAPLAGRLTARSGPALPMVCGLVCTGGGLLGLTAVGAGASYALWWPVLLPIGCGVGLTMTPTNAAIMGSVEPARAGVASAVSAASQQVGNVLGIAVIGAVMTAGFSSALAHRAADLGLSPGARHRLVHVAVEGDGEVAHGRGGPRRQAVASAFTSGIHQGLAVGGAAYLVGAGLTVAFVGRPRGGAGSGKGSAPRQSAASAASGRPPAG
jgi:EmrB/QacA subfamily drug resistance transporter